MEETKKTILDSAGKLLESYDLEFVNMGKYCEKVGGKYGWGVSVGIEDSKLFAEVLDDKSRAHYRENFKDMLSFEMWVFVVMSRWEDMKSKFSSLLSLSDN